MGFIILLISIELPKKKKIKEKLPFIRNSVIKNKELIKIKISD